MATTTTTTTTPETCADSGAVYRRGNTYTWEARLYLLGGNDRPYFSLTGAIYTGRRSEAGRTERNMTNCGAIGDTLAELFPRSFGPLNAIHLADDTGAPMHAVENAAYWLGLTKWKEYNRDVLARHLRITTADADKLQRSVTAAGAERRAHAARLAPFDHPDDVAAARRAADTLERAALVAFIDASRPRWQREAHAAAELIRSGTLPGSGH